jgi:pimeloyl-ACP methyl ester carboxylesterase
VSTPPYLHLPNGVLATSLATPCGSFAGLRATPGVTARGTSVLVPGFTGSKEDFLAVLAPLAATGFDTVAFDQRGQWETPGPETADAYSLAGFGTDLLAVMAALGPKVHVVGHSYGGLVARAAALAEPQRFASLTLLCSGPGPLPHPHRDQLRLFADVLDEHGLEVLWAAKSALEREQGNEGPDDEQVADFLYRRFVGSSSGSLLRMARDLVDTADRTDDLRGVGLPMQVVWGADDHYWPPQTQAQMARRLGVAGLAIPEAAHSPNVEQPQRLVELLTGFWASVQP